MGDANMSGLSVLGNIIAWLSSSAEINAPELERVRAMYKCK